MKSVHAALFAFLGFIWAFAATCSQKFADALFLVHVGAERLPQAYTFISCGMFGIAFILLYSFHHFSSYRIYSAALLSGITFYSFIFLYQHLYAETESTWFWFALKMAGAYLFAVLMTCYWTFIDQYHHLQDAKRLYGLFTAMIFLGNASTGLLMRSGILDLHDLILVIISLLGFAFFWVQKITSGVPLISHEDSEEGKVEDGGGYFKFFVKSIFSSRFTLLLMTSNFLIFMLLTITEYNYMFTFENDFGGQGDQLGEGTEAKLTLFLGQCLVGASIGNLFFGLFVYSRLVRNFGLNSLLFITPILLIIAFTGWSISSSLLFPLIGFFCRRRHSLRHRRQQLQSPSQRRSLPLKI